MMNNKRHAPGREWQRKKKLEEQIRREEFKRFLREYLPEALKEITSYKGKEEG